MYHTKSGLEVRTIGESRTHWSNHIKKTATCSHQTILRKIYTHPSSATIWEICSVSSLHVHYIAFLRILDVTLVTAIQSSRSSRVASIPWMDEKQGRPAKRGHAATSQPFHKHWLPQQGEGFGMGCNWVKRWKWCKHPQLCLTYCFPYYYYNRNNNDNNEKHNNHNNNIWQFVSASN